MKNMSGRRGFRLVEGGGDFVALGGGVPPSCLGGAFLGGTHPPRVRGAPLEGGGFPAGSTHLPYKEAATIR